ncbi:hypothetical protein K435DRAFT_959768 [Dendrothele bispora CBS 962.96]|uniref:RNase III domain-containing protein n=1 Tax=Dendrothele bispora (strain CBS 962.96) TaxID=1314807 RepID=A0A4S8MWZ5_DENBC|nr:hypothetical protein K435DRAFT_959768 [Dendrothele bispora CBS 962.96]
MNTQLKEQGSSVYNFIQKQLSSHIHSTAFQYFELPTLSSTTWNSIQNDGAEYSRLGFLGDALMNTFVAECIYKQMKQQGDAGVFTAARSALVSNRTFGQIMRRLGYSDGQGPIQKCEADVFETVIGAYFRESGSEAVKKWQVLNYTPLVLQVAQICRSLPARRKKRKSFKIMIPRPLITTPLRARRSQTATSKSLIVSPLRDRLKSKDTRPSRVMFKAVSPIDLTADSDWEDTDDIVEIPPPESPPLRTRSSSEIFVGFGSSSNPIIID